MQPRQDFQGFLCTCSKQRAASSVPDHGSPLLPGSRCMLGRQRAQMPVTSLTAPFELIFCTLSVELVQNWPQTPSYAKIASSRCTIPSHTKKTDYFFKGRPPVVSCLNISCLSEKVSQTRVPCALSLVLTLSPMQGV